MTMTQRIILTGVFLFIGFCTKTSFGQGPCTGYTWVTVPGASPLNSSTSSSASLAECQSSCVSQSECYGVSWRGGNCDKNLDSLINYNNSGSDMTIYYSLIRSLTNCNQPPTCTYYWYGSKDVHGFYGVNKNKTSLNDCVKSCQEDNSCAVLDWDTIASSCYHFASKPDKYNATGIYHFEKDCQILTTIPTTTTTTASSATTTNTTTTTVRPSNTTGSLLPTPTVSTSTSSNTASVIPIGSTIAASASNTSASSSASASSSSASSSASNASTTAPKAPGFQSAGGGGEYAFNPIAIKPAYIVLAGLGGGCLLLVLTAVIILCQYPLHGAETYSSSGTLVNGRGYASQEINMDTAVGEGGGEENVEFNPYYNRSELGAPDFTKEENIM